MSSPMDGPTGPPEPAWYCVRCGEYDDECHCFDDIDNDEPERDEPVSFDELDANGTDFDPND